MLPCCHYERKKKKKKKKKKKEEERERGPARPGPPAAAAMPLVGGRALSDRMMVIATSATFHIVWQRSTAQHSTAHRREGKGRLGQAM